MKFVDLSGMKIGEGQLVRIMAVINLSPESFYKGSVKTHSEEILQTAIRFEKEGADIIDVGAMSTAPYLETQISPEEETKRVIDGLSTIINEIKIPVSIDTTRSSVARAAIENGAKMINDVRGLNDDPTMAKTAAKLDVPIILGATALQRFPGNPTEKVIASLKDSIEKALTAGIRVENIIVDPDIGFHRKINNYKWYQIDSHVIYHLREILTTLDKPICVGISRKSFIGKILKLDDPKERLFGSLGATALAVSNGAHIVRTHDVKETLETVRVIEGIIDIADFLKN